jgi:hypothetical protein
VIAQENLTFDEEKHEYRWKGERVPGVSEILKTVGLTKDWSGVDPFYAARGKAVHRAIELYLADDLDDRSIGTVIRPFFDGFLKYWDKHGTKPVGIEVKRYNEDLAYAGTADLLVDDLIIDWKCSKSHDKVAELQGEAYKSLFPGLGFRVVQFPGDGSFKIFDYGTAVEYWPSAIKLYEWKARKK